MKSLLIKLVKYFTTIRYDIGFIEAKDLSRCNSTISPKIHWLRYPQKNTSSWYADPFILSAYGTSVQVLVEEYSYKEEKGWISLLDIDIKKGRYYLQKVTPVLSLSTHLSFPYIIKENDSIFVCPENYQSGGVSIYEYESNTHRLVFRKTIIDDPLVDVQFFKCNETYYAMGVLCNTGGLDESKKIVVYKSHSLLSKYEKVQTIKSDRKEERGAGQICEEGGCYVRPAQSSENGYGNHLVMYKLDFVDGEIREQELYRYRPCSFYKNGLSLHTFNKLGDLCVVDGHDYKNMYPVSRMIASCLKLLRRNKYHD